MKSTDLYLVTTTLAYYATFYVEGLDIVTATVIANRIVKGISIDATVTSVREQPIKKLSDDDEAK